MYEWWEKDGREHVATATGITDDGKLFRGFDEENWAWHLGCKDKDFKHLGLTNNALQLEKFSIGTEVCNAGSLDNKHKSWFGYQPPEDRVIELDYKKAKYFETYTDQECATLKYWTLLNALRFKIPLYYREWDMWNLSFDALRAVPGIYTHNSFREDKNDISPQPNIIRTAKELELYYT